MSDLSTTMIASGFRQAVPSDEAIVVSMGGQAPRLGTLSVSPLTATHGEEWAGAITGAYPGSTVTATSSDSTVLTVDGESVTGTFSAAGSKTVTLTETRVGASNSPRVTTVTVVVS